MVNISKFGDSAIKFKFTDNDHYLFNGEIEVPINSLLLVLDESDMVTFKKIDGDPFVSFLISNSNFASKNDLENFYKTSMVGSTGGGSESGITSGDVESMISASLEDYYDIDEIDAALSGKADSSAVTQEISAAVSGKADTSAVTEAINSAVSGKADASDVETALSAKQDISGMTAYTTSSDVETYVTGYTYDKATIDSKVASGGTFDPTNYYDKTAVDGLISGFAETTAVTEEISAAVSGKADSSDVTEAINAAVSGKADTSSVYTKSEVDTALSGKQDTLIAGDNITINGNVISAEAGDLSNYYTKSETSGATEISTALASKADTATTYTKTETDNAITAATSTKQDTLVSGTNIKTINNESILGSGNITIEGGGGKAVSGGTNISITTGETADTINCTLPIKKIQGRESVIIGDSRSTVDGDANVAVGYQNSIISKGGSYTPDHCFVGGEYNIVYNTNETAFGLYNKSIQNTLVGGASGTTLFSVGNGTAYNARHNAFEIRQNGDIYCSDGTNDVKLQDTITATAANTTALGGLKLVKLTQSAYDALATKDSNTLYIING